MKKTLQIMMVAASALLGAVSCGGGGGNGASTHVAVQPISPKDFAEGKMGYTMTIQGVPCLLRGQGGSSTETGATVTSGIFRLDDAEGGEYVCQFTYQLNAPITEAPTEAKLTIEFDKDSFNSIKEDLYFKKFWGITDESKMKDSDEYTLTLTFSHARVTAKSPSGERNGLFKVEPFTSPDGGAGDAPGA